MESAAMPDRGPAGAEVHRTSRSRRPRAAAAWDAVTLLPNPAPEIDRDVIDLSARFLGRSLGLPLLIDAGADAAIASIAAVAGRWRLPAVLGYVLPSLADGGRLTLLQAARAAAPDVHLFGELPASALVPQLERDELDPAWLQGLLAETGLDGLVVRLDFTELALGGQRGPNGTGFLDALLALVRRLRLPVLIRGPVGIPRRLGRELVERGAAALVVAGAEVASARAAHDVAAPTHTSFAGWGIPPLAALRMLRSVGVPLLCDGALASGLDVARALALGADLVVVRADDPTELAADLESIARDLRVAMFLTGSPRLQALRLAPFVATGETREWLEAAESLWRADTLGN